MIPNLGKAVKVVKGPFSGKVAKMRPGHAFHTPLGRNVDLEGFCVAVELEAQVLKAPAVRKDSRVVEGLRYDQALPTSGFNTF